MVHMEYSGWYRVHVQLVYGRIGSCSGCYRLNVELVYGRFLHMDPVLIPSWEYVLVAGIWPQVCGSCKKPTSISSSCVPPK